MTELLEVVKRYQDENGTEFDPQLILFTLSGCPICGDIISNLKKDGYSYEEFDCNKDEHSDIADHLEDVLSVNRYPFIFITYPEPNIIITEMLDENKDIYPQITQYLN
jgi:glutaredoxin